MTIYSLDVLLFLFGTSVFFHVQFELLLPDLQISQEAGQVLSKSLIQFSVDGRGCVPSLLFDLRPNYGGGNEDNGKTSCSRSRGCTAVLNAPHPAEGSCGLLETTGHSQASLGQSLVGTLLLSPGSWCAQGFLLVPSKSLFPQSCGSSVIKSHWPPKSNSMWILSPFAGSPGWGMSCGL